MVTLGVHRVIRRPHGGVTTTTIVIDARRLGLTADEVVLHLAGVVHVLLACLVARRTSLVYRSILISEHTYTKCFCLVSE